jgi:chromosome segregation ATPase
VALKEVAKEKDLVIKSLKQAEKEQASEIASLKEKLARMEDLLGTMRKEVDVRKAEIKELSTRLQEANKEVLWYKQVNKKQESALIKPPEKAVETDD